MARVRKGTIFGVKPCFMLGEDIYQRYNDFINTTDLLSVSPQFTTSRFLFVSFFSFMFGKHLSKNDHCCQKKSIFMICIIYIHIEHRHIITSYYMPMVCVCCLYIVLLSSDNCILLSHIFKTELSQHKEQGFS